MKKFYTIMIMILSFILISSIPVIVNSQTLDIPLTWTLGDESTAGYYIYFDNDGLDPMNGLGSPIDITDPNQTSTTVSGLEMNVWHFKIKPYNSLYIPGPASNVVVYDTIKSIEALDCGTYGEGSEVTFRINFNTSSYLGDGNMILIMNNGKRIEVPSPGQWRNYLDINYTIGSGEEISCLAVDDAYLDPNDDVYLHGQNGWDICTDIISGTNMCDDPNHVCEIEIVGTPGAVTLTIDCCTN